MSALAESVAELAANEAENRQVLADARVTREPDVYERHQQARDGVSFYRDMVFRERDPASADRLERHARQIELERRTNPDRVQGIGGYFAPPLWAIDQFAKAPRPNRSLAVKIDKAGNRFPLPLGVQSINLPRMTTGIAGAGGYDLAAVPSTDVIDAATTSPVVTIEGQSDVALQLFEQSPVGPHLDWVFFQDLTAAYDGALETMLLAGTGPTAQPTAQFFGLLNLPGTNGVVYTSGTPTATGMFPLLGSVLAQVGNKRKRMPTLFLMTTSRAGWLGSSEDSSSRPLMIANNSQNGSFDLLAVDVAVSDAIPITLSGNPNGPPANGTLTLTGGNQDAIIACIPADMVLWESQPTTAVRVEVLSGTLQARLQYRGYAAFICRYPMGVTVFSGTGLAIQSGF